MTPDRRCLGSRMFRASLRLASICEAIGWRVAAGPDREITKEQMDEASEAVMPYVRMTEDELQRLFVVGFSGAFVPIAIGLLRGDLKPITPDDISDMIARAAIQALEQVIIEEREMPASTETMQ